MGYRKIPTIYDLDLAKKYPGLEVRMKGLSFGKVRKLLKATESADDQNFDILLDEMSRGLVSWNLEDEGGRAVPATEDGVNDQEFEFVMDIVLAWLEVAVGVDDELGKGSPSGQQFPGLPVTMEAL